MSHEMSNSKTDTLGFQPHPQCGNQKCKCLDLADFWCNWGCPRNNIRAVFSWNLGIKNQGKYVTILNGVITSIHNECQSHAGNVFLFYHHKPTLHLVEPPELRSYMDHVLIPSVLIWASPRTMSRHLLRDNHPYIQVQRHDEALLKITLLSPPHDIFLLFMPIFLLLFSVIFVVFW